MPCNIDIVVGTSLRQDILLVRLVESCWPEMLVWTETLSGTAGVDGAASDELIGVALADVKVGSGGACDVQVFGWVVIVHYADSVFVMVVSVGIGSRIPETAEERTVKEMRST